MTVQRTRAEAARAYETDAARDDPPAHSLLQLQRTAGNAAVARLVQRAATAAPPTPIARLRKLLQDEDEEAAMAQMAALTPDDAKRILDLPEFRILAVRAFNDKEMARAVRGLKGGTLAQKLRWLAAEGVDELKLVRPLLVDAAVPASEKTDLYPLNDIRSFFIDVCDDDEMAVVVDLLGGVLNQKLAWMASEGTNGSLVFPKVRAASDADLRTVTGATRAALKRELSKADFARLEQMLDEALLNWQQIDYKQTEQHYELADESDPSKGWELKKDFEWRAKYEILYNRSELRIRVRIKLKGEPAEEKHKKIWRDGIANRWNGKFHLENDRKLALVFEPIFTDTKAHHEIELHKPPIVRENSSNWYVGPTANADATKPPDTTTGDTAAHEFGHLVGLIDEYRLTAAEFTRLTGRAPTAADQDWQIGYTIPRLMSAGQADVEARHLTTFVDWLNAHRRAGERAYRLVPGPP